MRPWPALQTLISTKTEEFATDEFLEPFNIPETIPDPSLTNKSSEV